MRQMETILVAVGVPTKEIPGASIALPHFVTVTEETVDIPDQALHRQQVNETQKPAEDAETCKAEGRDVGDGWDIPDISDLLDSLNDAESERQPGVRNNLPLASEGESTNHGPASACNAQSDCEEDADPDNEHESWGWDDTHWTTEHTHIQRGADL